MVANRAVTGSKRPITLRSFMAATPINKVSYTLARTTRCQVRLAPRSRKARAGVPGRGHAATAEPACKPQACRDK